MNELQKQILALPALDRIQLVTFIANSIQLEQQTEGIEISQEQIDETRRRMKAIEEGKAELLSSEQVKANMTARKKEYYARKSYKLTPKLIGFVMKISDVLLLRNSLFCFAIKLFQKKY